jgi:hypothetical protein
VPMQAKKDRPQVVVVVNVLVLFSFSILFCSFCPCCCWRHVDFMVAAWKFWQFGIFILEKPNIIEDAGIFGFFPGLVAF